MRMNNHFAAVLAAIMHTCLSFLRSYASYVSCVTHTHSSSQTDTKLILVSFRFVFVAALPQYLFGYIYPYDIHFDSILSSCMCECASASIFAVSGACNEWSRWCTNAITVVGIVISPSTRESTTECRMHYRKWTLDNGQAYEWDESVPTDSILFWGWPLAKRQAVIFRVFFCFVFASHDSAFGI